jgi:ElaB/YqjD/DUF883 family membrane-anchored ribosome-binding protein
MLLRSSSLREDSFKVDRRTFVTTSSRSIKEAQANLYTSYHQTKQLLSNSLKQISQLVEEILSNTTSRTATSLSKRRGKIWQIMEAWQGPTHARLTPLGSRRVAIATSCKEEMFHLVCKCNQYANSPPSVIQMDNRLRLRSRCRNVLM